jgi:hypothetical protein
MKRSTQQGSALIEPMTVVAIIGFLAAITVTGGNLGDSGTMDSSELPGVCRN